MSDFGNYEKGIRQGDGPSPLFLYKLLVTLVKYSIMMLLIQSVWTLQNLTA